MADPEPPAAPGGTPRRRRHRRILGLGAIAVLIPLALLLWLQYRWLGDLERASAVARQSLLDNYLEVIASEVKFHYLTTADRLLSLPVDLFQGRRTEAIVPYFRRAVDPAARRLFMVDFRLPEGRGLFFYAPESESFDVPADTPEAAAVRSAVAPWRLLYDRRQPPAAGRFIGEEREPEHRLILMPLLDDNGLLLGMLGMVLDEPYFRSTLLPQAIARALPELRDAEGLRVSVRDDRGRWVFGDQVFSDQIFGEDQVGQDLATEVPLPSIHRRMLFVFKNWEVFLVGPDSTPQDWARTNFTFNLSLTAALSLLVIGGLALVLRTTSREMRLSEMKQDFVSNVSHELRTPLASIRVFGEFLRLGRFKDNGKVREYGEYIETESRRLTRLIDNILDFSSIEAGRKSYLFEDMDLVEMVDDCLSTWKVRLEHQAMRIDFPEPAARPVVRADAEALGQALFNLIDNAVKYSGGSQRIVVRVLSGGDDASIEVEDFGLGISRAEQRYIFERFHRVGNGLTHDVKGSGLGLAIVQHILRAHGGRVSVRSQLGRGSTFSLHLPLSRQPSTQDHGTPTPSSPSN